MFAPSLDMVLPSFEVEFIPYIHTLSLVSTGRTEEEPATHVYLENQPLNGSNGSGSSSRSGTVVLS